MAAVPEAAVPMTQRQGGSYGQTWQRERTLPPAQGSEALSTLCGNHPGRCWQ